MTVVEGGTLADEQVALREVWQDVSAATAALEAAKASMDDRLGRLQAAGDAAASQLAALQALAAELGSQVRATVIASDVSNGQSFALFVDDVAVPQPAALQALPMLLAAWIVGDNTRTPPIVAAPD